MEEFVGGLAVVRADQKGSVFKHQTWLPFLQLLRNFQYKIEGCFQCTFDGGGRTQILFLL